MNKKNLSFWLLVVALFSAVAYIISNNIDCLVGMTAAGIMSKLYDIDEQIDNIKKNGST
jgi:hypothetical protein